MLRAMQLDSDSSVFLGRPCYYQVVDKRCQGVWWTRNRYHSKVVDSLVEIIERLSKDRDQIWLIGHSGGGTLAVLVGRRLSRQVNVVTIAANLDHSVWTDYHGYTPLSGSLNPVSDDRRNPAMKELHFIGNDDKTILPEWFNDYCGSNSAMCITEPNKNHQNGWVENWPLTLEQSRYFFAEK